MPESIIVYRSPVEAAFWEMVSNGELFPVIVGILVFFVVFLTANKFITGGSAYKSPAWKTNLALGIGILACCLTIWKMMAAIS